jgi:hypothetical protein
MGIVAAINWDQLAAVTAVLIAAFYPLLGLFWRWIKHTEDRFDELRDGIRELQKNDSVDVRDLKAFKSDVGRRLQRIEDHVWP